MKILIPVFLFLLLFAGCTRHHADNVTGSGSATAFKGLADSLVGAWTIAKIEYVPADTSSKPGFVEILTNKVISVSQNKTCSITVNDKTEKGTWKVTGDRHIEIQGSATEKAIQFEIVSFDWNSLVVKYPGDRSIVATLTR